MALKVAIQLIGQLMTVRILRLSSRLIHYKWMVHVSTLVLVLESRLHGRWVLVMAKLINPIFVAERIWVGKARQGQSILILCILRIGYVSSDWRRWLLSPY